MTDTSARVPAWSTESMILACQPDWLKVRARLVTTVRSDEDSRALVQSIAARGAAFGARVVAEGVDCPADIARLGLELPASPADPVEPVPRVEA